MKGIIWFRRDLRTIDNPALHEAYSKGVREAIYIATPKQWEQHKLSPLQADFIERHVNHLNHELHSLGIKLACLEATDYSDQTRQICHYCHSQGIEVIYLNQELELNECLRDKCVGENGFRTISHQCDTVAPLGSVLNKQGSMFKVFTPFKKAWLTYVQANGIQVSPSPQQDSNARHSNLESSNYCQFKYQKADSTNWPLIDTVIDQVIPQFFTNKLADYKTHRDFPAIKGTSGLSPYLAIGALSPRWLVHLLIQRSPEVLYDTNRPDFSWLNELIWRDFYKHLLFHHPTLIKGRGFNPKYDQLNWLNDKQDFQAWCEGTTGYPLVDAAMSQLLKTGWMHNRLRMVVASFLTKHLLVDWRWGEAFFMQHLIDGDFSANNGGWQWAASTGCDAQPYFRIFNPITQSEKFDPQGDFIRKFIPELRSVPDKYIHFPHQYLQENDLGNSYPPPIVEHKFARARAIEFYQK
ncbi:deoxyribodipyrimidine photo-lyase [Vibrio sp. S4M6]|uniref:deoxyribodipyrimidine photo-lyase n=1 Tax=Vibrio sinus TaxID=2946865 RepID=UPI00202A8E8A|nr:deoxyribodipyrimidine photo-lyase [Vibrio sinus]MCL9780827.1 deoxyribodipyrimidine photo-lyase [Vibrio sinus]